VAPHLAAPDVYQKVSPQDSFSIQGLVNSDSVQRSLRALQNIKVFVFNRSINPALST
jgi:hypothetical protein